MCVCVYGCTCVKSKCFITKNDLFFFFIFYCICFIPRFVQIFNCLLQFVVMSNTHGSDEKTIFFAAQCGLRLYYPILVQMYRAIYLACRIQRKYRYIAYHYVINSYHEMEMKTFHTTCIRFSREYFARIFFNQH